MKSLIKMSCCMCSIALVSLCSITTFAVKTPYFDSLTPTLQYALRKYGEDHKKWCSKKDTPEDIAECNLLKRHNVEIDGSYCYMDSDDWRAIKPKLTNADIESLNNLKKMNDLTLSNFDLTEVDLTKFLEINTGQEMKVVCLDGCKFSQSYEEIKSLLSREGYTVGTAAGVWITWPGVDPHSIFEGR